MKTISVINYKGGVGKTTITANLAAELARRGETVLLIDLDPQSSLTFSFFGVDDWARDYSDKRTILNWYNAYIYQDQNLELPSLIVRPDIVEEVIDGSGRGGYLDIICSHLTLINIDLELAARLSSGSMAQMRNNFLRLHSRLLDGLESPSTMYDGLEPPSIKGLYDYIIIDWPPNFNIVTKTAIVASDRILIPTIPDFLSTLGIEELQRHITELVRNFNDFAERPGEPSYKKISPSIMGVIPTMVDIRSGKPINTHSAYIDRIKQTGLPVFDTVIRRNSTRYGDAAEYGVPVVLQSASGQTYTTIQAELEQLTTEFLRRV